MRLLWDQTGEKLAETGISQGVIYPYSSGSYQTGVPWNGLTSVSESPSGAEANPFYADNQKYIEVMSEEEFAGSIGCYIYPDAFKACIGEVELGSGVIVSGQTHQRFGFVYRNEVANDTDGTDYGYKIHVVYGALAGVSEREHSSINDSPDLEELSYDFTTTKVAVTGAKPTAHLIIDSSKITDPTVLQAIIDNLYGRDAVGGETPVTEITAHILMPNEIAALLSATPDALTLSTIVPADDATDVAIDATIVMTFNNEISSENVVVAASDGTIVTGVKTWDSTGKILTFTPSADLTNNTVYNVTIVGVVDIYYQTLAPVIKSFTTIAG